MALRRGRKPHRTCEWSQVCLRLEGKYLDPEEVTRSLGIQPDGWARLGEPWYRLPEKISKRGYWRLTSRLSEGRIEAQIKSILRRIAPAKDRLRRLLQRDETIKQASLKISFAPCPGCVNPCYRFNAKLMNEFTSLGLDIALSIYVPERFDRIFADTSETVLEQVQEAERDKDWLYLCEILHQAEERDVKLLRPLVPRLINHRDNSVRRAVLYLLGKHGLRGFSGLVKARLKDRNVQVRTLALMVYYHLVRAKALPAIKKLCKGRDSRIRLPALVYDYVETRDQAVFQELSRILTRKNCTSSDRYTALQILDHYLDAARYPEIGRLLETILRDLPPSSGLAKDIRSNLKKWSNGQPRTLEKHNE